jgi:hypothetical protein
VSLARATRGIVYAEFLIAFVPFFLLFLGGVQLAFMATARIVVRHAAVQAARAAVVAIDDDPYFDGDDATQRKHVSATGEGREGKSVSALTALLPGDGPELGRLRSKGCDRLKRIRSAAYAPLSTLAPPLDQLGLSLPGLLGVGDAAGGQSLSGAIGESPWLRVLGGLALYNRAAAAITFPEEPGSATLLDSHDIEFADDQVVTVRVTYLYRCGVPIVRDIMCSTLFGMTGLPEALQKTLSALEEPSVESVRAAYQGWAEKFPDDFARFKRDYAELSEAEWFVLLMMVGPHERFAVLRGEASLPNQGAAYEYASERCKTKKKVSDCEDET